jgi:dTDP-4-dehydrorhamnose reductase
MAKQILILGAKGMLGQAIVREFSDDKKYQVIAWDREDLDITDGHKTVKTIRGLKPDIIINVAAYTDVDKAESNKDLAMRVNGEVVGILASASSKIGAFFIHISTDYVFQGDKKDGYKEDDIPRDPLNVYGKSKLLGEKLLLEAAEQGLDYYLIRTSWLFGHAPRGVHDKSSGKNFVDTMLKLAEEKNELEIVNDQYGKPTYAKDLAKMIKYMIKSKMDSGVYHFTNEPRQTWCSFTKLIFEIKKEISPKFKIPKIISIKTEQFLRPAKRPKYSVLLNTKLPKGKNIKDALREYLEKE